MAKGTSIFTFILGAAGGAVVGALAVRAMDKYLLKKDEEEAPKELPPAQGYGGMPSFGAGQYPFTPVFLPAPIVSPFGYPTQPMLQQPGYGTSPPASRGPVEDEDRDVVDEITKEWEDEDGY